MLRSPGTLCRDLRLDSHRPGAWTGVWLFTERVGAGGMPLPPLTSLMQAGEHVERALLRGGILSFQQL